MVGIISLAAVLIYFSGPRIIHCGKKPDQTEAVNGARQIGIALTEFQEQYGKFPDTSTIELVKQKTASDLNLGTRSSNDFFRQLLATGIAQSESPFYAKIAGTQKPDNNFTKDQALKKGECGFAYFIGALNTDNPLRPIAISPMIPGTDRFDPKPFEGKAVILRADNSVTSVPIILKTGHIRLGGQDLMDPANPIWDGHPPIIAWPDL
jgi:hypothetical protein